MATTKFDHKGIEKKWSERWAQEHINATIDNGKEKMYILDMFPYPSGAGLHVGHVEGYTATDIVSRYYRMNGKAVLHPMGWDAFGLPAENYAIKTGIHPRINTNESIKTFKKQIDATGLSYDWSWEIGTHNPDYYKWTQWFFLFLYKKGLAYKKEAPVNWCDSCKTVLANEQVVDGRCERCDTEVVQKNMSQWFFKITDYAERLIKDLEKVDWPESTKINQINWIGKNEGINIEYPVVDQDKTLTVFTTRPDTNYGATFVVLAPDSQFVKENMDEFPNAEEVRNYAEETKKKTELERISEGKKKTGVNTGWKVVNRLNGKELPVYVSDFVLGNVGTGCVVGVPGHDMRDFEFAQAMGIEIVRVVVGKDGDASTITDASQVQEEEGTMVNSGFLDGLDIHEATKVIMDHIEKEGWGKRVVNYKLRDWSISRQRFWGAPIPIVYDKDGNTIPVEETDLPVMLPDDVEFMPTGRSPLTDHPDFVTADPSKYGEGARREPDTMDTFVCSSWYFFRFCDPHNETEFASKESMKKWAPVDIYVGGAEHTVLHLMYARFFTKVLFDEGYIDFDEPFLKLRHPGTIMGEDSRKMSKRWGNIINPLDVIDSLGADALRIYEMFMGPFDQSKPWNTQTIQGVRRFLDRVYDFRNKVIEGEADVAVESELNKLIKKVGSDIPQFKFNTAVAEFMKFVNFIEEKGTVTRDQWYRFITTLAPFAPFLAEELWAESHDFDTWNASYSVHAQAWPIFDEQKIQSAGIVIGIQVNGKLRSEIEIDQSDSEDDIKQKALQKPEVMKWTEGKEIKKVIYVPGKIISVVVA